MTITSPNFIRNNDLLSAIEPDWTRERSSQWWDPGRRLLHSIRHYRRCRDRDGIWLIVSKWHVFRHRFWTIISGADIPLTASIGGGLLIPHPNGIVIHPDVVIGPNCIIFQQVTLGTRDGAGTPHIGGDVELGAGAKILGPLHVGDHARIGANAVVLADVPDYGIAVGVPARIAGFRKGYCGNDSQDQGP